jgi:hypothetical protein
MAFTDKQEFNIPRHIVQKGGVNVESITGDVTLTYKSAQYQRLDADTTGHTVNLPDVKDGAMFVVNCQGNAITVSGTGVSKLLSVGEGAMFCCDGTNWKQFI